jgi:hypothetical protein
MELTNSSKIKFNGNTYTLEQFAMKFCSGDIDVATGVLKVYVKKGTATILDERNKDEKVMDNIASEEAIRYMAESIENEEEASKDFKKSQKDTGKLRYAEINVAYPTYMKASDAERYFIEALRLKNQTEVTSRGGAVALKFYNITDSDLTFINRVYTRDKVVDGTMGAVNKVAEKTTDAVDYTAKRVLAPTAQIVTKAGVSIIKTIFGTVAKTGAVLTSATTNGVKDTYHDIKNDPDMIKASRDLIEVKDAARRGISKSFGGSNNSGITIVQQ